MNEFYRLEHYHVTYGYLNSVYIGTFTSLQLVEEVIDRLIDKPGFNKHPRSCFKIQKVIVDDFGWKNGFVKTTEGDVEIK